MCLFGREAPLKLVRNSFSVSDCLVGVEGQAGTSGAKYAQQLKMLCPIVC